LLEQYFGMKEQYPEAILLSRVGDFYEAYGDDAETIARALQIALTSKEASAGQRVAMAGVPHHALDGYLAKLVAQRFVVALAEQLEAPVPNRLVRRGIIRVVTPGTLIEDRMLETGRNAFLASIEERAGVYALLYADLSTGETAATLCLGEDALDDLCAELARVAPVEVVAQVASSATRATIERVVAGWGARFVPETMSAAFSSTIAATSWPTGLAADERLALDAALARLTGYAARVGFTEGALLRAPRLYRRSTFALLDSATRRHLDLLESASAHASASLRATLDRTRTAMGARLLSRWILAPLIDPVAITARADTVAQLVEDYAARSEFAESLGRLYDLERIAQRVRLRRAMPRDLASLRRTLCALEPLRLALQPVLPVLADRIADFVPLHEELARAVLDEPAANLSDGGVMRPSCDEELAACHDLRTRAQQHLAALEERERARTGIRSLKVKYASAFGYGIEVPRTHVGSVPPEWTRRQTLAAAERYVTPELKELEAEIASSGQRAIRLEEQLYRALLERVALDVDALLASAEAIAELDVLVAFAQIAAERNYVRPQILAESRIDIEDGRHPVIEVLRGEHFVPNDLRLDTDHERFLLITGPNMGGKSTYLRQTALLILMAQIGSFVPVRSMQWGILDRIFTRIGAGDDLASGQSTFYVEMVETARILQRCTPRSLVLIDEVGRGTGTSDGFAIAQAICEHILAMGCDAPMTLFATHFHELVTLADAWPLLANYHVTAVEQLGGNGEPVFSHRVLPGSTSRSFGIDVARMAGLPPSVIARAREIAATLTPVRSMPPAGRTRAARNDETTAQLAFVLEA